MQHLTLLDEVVAEDDDEVVAEDDDEVDQVELIHIVEIE